MSHCQVAPEAGWAVTTQHKEVIDETIEGWRKKHHHNTQIALCHITREIGENRISQNKKGESQRLALMVEMTVGTSQAMKI